MAITIFRFKEFPVYKDALKFRKELKQLSKNKFPKEEDFILRPQLWRSLDSIVLNIAEGSDKYSDKDFSHFLNISLGSLNEVVGCVDCALGDGYISAQDHADILVKADGLSRQLKAFLSKIRKDNHRS